MKITRSIGSKQTNLPVHPTNSPFNKTFIQFPMTNITKTQKEWNSKSQRGAGCHCYSKYYGPSGVAMAQPPSSLISFATSQVMAEEDGGGGWM
jgi:hypothetical protein